EPAPRGNSPVERQKPPQELEMVVSPISDGVEAVALGDRGANAQQQNLVQLVSNAFRTPFVLDPGKVVQKKPQPRRSRGFVRRGVHQTGSESGAHRFSLSATRKSQLTRVRSPGLIGGVLDQRVLETVGGVGWVAAAKHEL